MAEVTLGRYELTLHEIPATCMVCGQPATQRVTQTFSWRRHGEVTSLGNPLIKMTLDAPMCARHGRHWAWRDWFKWIMLLIVFLVVILTNVAHTTNLVRALALPVGTLLAFLLLLVSFRLNATMIRPTEITDRAITLTNVAEQFVADLAETREDLPEKENDFRLGPGEVAEPPPTDGSFRPGRM